MALVEPTTKIMEPIPAIVRPGRPYRKNQNNASQDSLRNAKIPSASLRAGKDQNGHGNSHGSGYGAVVPPKPGELAKGEWSEQALKVLNERYLLKDDEGLVIEDADQMCWRVAWDVACANANFGKNYEEITQIAKDYCQLLISRNFLPNSPTLMNAGKGNGLQYNGCFVIPIEDSMEGIFDGIKWAAIIHKSGGGTGFAFSRLRPSNSRVGSTKGIASGPISFLKVYDAATEQIKQGGSRRGANMGVLRIDHPDVMEFIHCKEDGGITNFNISVGVTEAFMKAYYGGTDYDLVDPKTKRIVAQLSARKVMDEIADGAWKTGDPGMIFIDRVNASSANPVPRLGPIETTNPCVTGDTRITAQEGLVKMRDIVESHFPGGKRHGGNMGLIIDKRTLDQKETGTTEGRATKFFDNGVKDVLQLVTKAGLELTATPEHKLLTPVGWRELVELKVGDKILVQSGEGEFGKNFELSIKSKIKNYPTKWTLELGRVLGWLVADGWLRTGDKNCRVGFTFGKKDKTHLDYFQKIINFWYGRPIKSVKRVRNTSHLSYHGKDLVNFFLELGVKPVKAGEKEVPESIYTAPREAVVGFLQGLFTADGTIGIQEINNTRYIRLTSKSKLLLRGVQLLLLNLGILSHIYDRSRKARGGMFKYVDVHGNERSYTLDGVLYELQVSRDNISLFITKVGLIGNSHEEKIARLRSYSKYYKSEFIDEVENIYSAGRQRVYDLTEQKSYTFITNGIVSYDCGEQPLYPFDACNLGSIFLGYFIKETDEGIKTVDWEKLRVVTKTAVRFLDDVIERNPLPLPQIKGVVSQIRRIGLGVGGWADMLIELGVAYDSEEAIALAERIMKFINDAGHETSQELAAERGPFPLFPESIYKNEAPIRNSTVTTIAPTGTIGIIAGASTGIEPLFAIAFRHYVKTNALEREMSFLNPLFEKMATGQAWYTDSVKEKIADGGTIAHIEEIPVEVRQVFRTAHDIEPSWHVRMQAAFQKYTDNAVSKTINLPNSATRGDIKKAYLQAYESGCLGITIYRDGSKSIQVLNLGTQGRRQEGKKIAEPAVVLQPRPVRVDGATYRIETPLGTAFITVNQDNEGNPFEVFVSVGKAGSEVAAMAEAIGRLISTTLRFGNHLPARERAMEIVDQLQGIGGPSAVGFGPNRIRSLPDAVAKAIGLHFGLSGQGNGISSKGYGEEATIPVIHNTDPIIQKAHRDLCPSCGAAAFVFEEGCAKCYSCGYSKC